MFLYNNLNILNLCHFYFKAVVVLSISNNENTLKNTKKIDPNSLHSEMKFLEIIFWWDLDEKEKFPDLDIFKELVWWKDFWWIKHINIQ